MKRYRMNPRVLWAAAMVLALQCPALAAADEAPLRLARKDVAAPVDEQTQQMENLDARTLKGVTGKKKNVIGGKGVTGVTGGTAAPLTKADCIKLGCTTYTDSTCPNVGGITERCACQGGGNTCINEVK